MSPKQPDRVAGLQARQPFVFLRVAPERMDGVHHQRALHGNKTAQTGIAALEFLGHQAIGDVGHAGAAIAVKIGAEKPEFAKLRNQVLGKRAFAAVLFNDGDDFVVHELAGGLADKFFFVVQQGIEINEIHTSE